MATYRDGSQGYRSSIESWLIDIGLKYYCYKWKKNLTV